MLGPIPLRLLYSYVIAKFVIFHNCHDSLRHCQASTLFTLLRHFNCHNSLPGLVFLQLNAKTLIVLYCNGYKHIPPSVNLFRTFGHAKDTSEIFVIFQLTCIHYMMNTVLQFQARTFALSLTSHLRLHYNIRFNVDE